MTPAAMSARRFTIPGTPAVVPSYAATILGMAGTSGFWPMDDPDDVMRDASAGAHNGAYQGVGVHNVAGPQAGVGATRFTPTGSQYARVASTGLPNSADSDFSFIVWGKITGSGGSGYKTLVNRGGGSPRQIYTLVDPSSIYYRWNAFSAPGAVSSSAWHMFGYGYQAGAGGGERLFLDGVKTAGGSLFSGALQGSFWTLANTEDLASTHTFQGDMCRFSLHSRLLSDAEFSTLWSRGS